VGQARALSKLRSVLQTELLPRCGEVAPVGQVVHENGKVLLQAVLEVRGTGTTGSLGSLGLGSRAGALKSRGLSRVGLLCGRVLVARLPAASWITSQKSSLP